MNKYFLIIVVLILGACSAKLSSPAQSDADRAVNKFPDATLEKLIEGRRLVQANCGLCHPVKNPQSHSEEQWNKIVPEMVGKANRKKDANISDEQQKMILMYLVTMGKK
jgi:cytochrome c5